MVINILKNEYYMPLSPEALAQPQHANTIEQYILAAINAKTKIQKLSTTQNITPINGKVFRIAKTAKDSFIFGEITADCNQSTLESIQNGERLSLYGLLKLLMTKGIINSMGDVVRSLNNYQKRAFFTAMAETNSEKSAISKRIAINVALNYNPNSKIIADIRTPINGFGSTIFDQVEKAVNSDGVDLSIPIPINEPIRLNLTNKAAELAVQLINTCYNPQPLENLSSLRQNI
jgi:hypothetical protein